MGLLVAVLTRFRITSIMLVGYDPDNGRTIPDSWAQTHVLLPADIVKILRLRGELEEA